MITILDIVDDDMINKIEKPKSILEDIKKKLGVPELADIDRAYKAYSEINLKTGKILPLSLVIRRCKSG